MKKITMIQIRKEIETRKTGILIGCLVLLTVILFAFSLNGKQEQRTTITPATNRATVTTLETTLQLQPSQIKLTSKHIVTLQVAMNSGSNKITGVQFGLKYDPAVVSSIAVQPTGVLADKKVLFNSDDRKVGIFIFGAVISPRQSPVQGVSTIAQVTVTIKAGAMGTGSTKIFFSPPQTIVTAQGANIGSVLKSTTGTTIDLSNK